MRQFILFGKPAKYKSMSWWENFMGGHLNLGKNITIFGENAMHWCVQIRTKKYGVICITLPFRCFGKYWGCHIYCSPNGTPWACTYYKSIWKDNNKAEEIRAKIRKINFGHNFDTKENWQAMMCINVKFDSMIISDYDINKYEIEPHPSLR